MAGEDKVLMSAKALRRLHGIHRVMGKKRGQVGVARLPGPADGRRTIAGAGFKPAPAIGCIYPPALTAYRAHCRSRPP